MRVASDRSRFYERSTLTIWGHLMNNLVAKHARKFNRAQTHRDRKRALKSGYQKHKNKNSV